MKQPFTASSFTVPAIGLRVARALVLTVLGLLGGALAQTLPADYQRATDALAQSVSVFPDDPVASLDALRRAKEAFAPLSEGLEAGLSEGLGATFGRAEQAIVNRSETDLHVQAAVLRGGFQRILYRQALVEASVGNVRRARSLLGVLASDLGFSRQTFGGDTPRALQAAFERHLAALSLDRLGALGEDREARYRTLAQLYGYIFLVQDSPRLPAQTQATLVATIQQLVAGEALGPSLSTLRAQLERFAEAAAATGQNRPTGEAVADAETAEPKPETTEPETGAPETSEPKSLVTAAPTLEPGAANAGTGVERADNRADAAARSRTDPEQAAAQAEAPTGTPIGTPTRTPVAPAPDSATGDTRPQNTAAPASPTAPLLGNLHPPLLIASGLLALVALGRLLRHTRSTQTPWQDAALALLLLPAALEGLIRLAMLLAPSFNLPELSILGSYSLFRNPMTQLLWVGLVVLAVICLALGWRASARTVAARTAAEKSAEVPSAPPSPPQSQPASRPLASVSTLNWDEDF